MCAYVNAAHVNLELMFLYLYLFSSDHLGLDNLSVGSFLENTDSPFSNSH